jgi:hypothetical protein
LAVRFLAFAVVSLLLAVANRIIVPVAILWGLALLYLFATWLLSPYWGWAMRRRLPPESTIDRAQSAALAVGRLPVVGGIWRRLSNQPGADAHANDYRRWLRAERTRYEDALSKWDAQRRAR